MHKQFYFYSLSNKSEIRWLQLCRFLCREEKKKILSTEQGVLVWFGFFLFCKPTREQFYRNQGLWADIKIGLHLRLKLFLQFISVAVKRRQIFFRSSQWNQKSLKLNALLETQITVLRIKSNNS